MGHVRTILRSYKLTRCSTANPAYTADELAYQLNLTKASVIFTHSANLAVSEQAARSCGIPSERIVLLDSPKSRASPHATLDALVHVGLSKPALFVERRLSPGEGKTKIALLNFSSGTTGRPKAVAIPHYAVIANVLQMSSQAKVNVDYAPKEQQRYRPGQVAIAGKHCSILEELNFAEVASKCYPSTVSHAYIEISGILKFGQISMDWSSICISSCISE